MTAPSPTRTTWLCAVAALAVACAPLPSRAQPETRVLGRDPSVGGPAGVSLADLTPLFAGEAADALRALDAGRTSAAIDALSTFLDDNPRDELRDEALMALGYALREAGRHEQAIEVLADCADEARLFVDYCAYWAALSALELGDFAGADAYAGLVAPDAVYGPRARFARGRAQAGRGDADGAIATLEAFLVDHADASYREDVEFALAEAYLAAARPDDAALVYRRVALLNPDSAAEARAERALDVLREEIGTAGAASPARSRPEMLERAEVLFERHRSDQVIALLEPVLRSEPAGSAVYCDAAYLVGKSYTKLRQHADALPVYADVVAHCSDEDLVVKALYNAGRAAWNADDNDEAQAYFRRLWTEHPASTYADDAYLLAARVALGDGAQDQAAELLHAQIDAYADGDMLGEAVWLLAKALIDGGDDRELVRFVDAQGTRTGEADVYSRGRLGYFRARGLELLSLQREARAALADVVRAHPMTYYAMLALARLHALDAGAARALVAELRTADPDALGYIEVRPAEVARDPFFLRGTTLLRLGLYGLAEEELNKLEARYPNEDEVGWVVSLLYHRAGAFDRSHHVPGNRVDLRLPYPNEQNIERWQVAYPTPFAASVDAAATARQLDRAWIYAIMRSESGFRPDIESWANARGLLQLMEGTANDMARLTGRGSVRAQQLFDPDINIELGTMYMRTLADRFDDHPFLVFAGYNGGAGNVNSWLRARRHRPVDLWVEEIPYDQTRNYVKGVGTSFWVYSWIYGDDPIPALDFDLRDIE